MSTDLSGATVLITGGTGTFGSTMTRRLLGGDCGEIRILSRDEAKQDAMRRRWSDSRLRLYLGDVRDPAAVARACRGVDYIFHAAALKQVPSCEGGAHQRARQRQRDRSRGRVRRAERGVPQHR
jgi:UDP-glucose 4-epimerase